MTSAWRTRARRISFGLAFLAAAWSAAILLTGGFDVRLAGIRVTSHAVLNPAIAALVAAAVVLWLGRPAPLAALAGDCRAFVGWARSVSPATYILAFGIALRLWYWLLMPPLWLDEEMIALNIRDRSLAGLAGPLWLGQAAPLGWLMTQRVVGLTLGFGELAMRAMPVAFGIGTVVVSWWAGRRWLSRAGAATFVFLVAVGEWMFHFSLELKHYSADTFFGLLLPVLVVWAFEGCDERQRLRRAAVWWLVAIAGQAWSMGGLLVAPACAIALLVSLWRRDRLRSPLAAALIGGAWLAVFALHYAVTLRFATGSTFLQQTWSNRMAPEAAGIAGRLTWLVEQGRPLAANPGGADLATLFFATAILGFVVARPRLLGAVLGAIPLSAALLGMARVTPIFERFTIWALPAMYFGIALALDAAIRWARPRMPAATMTRAIGVGVCAIVIVLSADIARRAYAGIPGTHHGATNHALDDRSAVEWLAAERRPGDALFTTHLGAPAVWWYAGRPIADSLASSSFSDMPIFEIEYHAPNPRCDAAAFEAAFNGRSRALIYLGFEDLPPGTKDQVLDALRELGTITSLRVFGKLSIAGIVELKPAADRVRPAGDRARLARPCFGTKPALRW